MLEPLNLVLQCERPELADFVAKRFCSSECARLIQDRAPMRNFDSRITSLRFDCCAFLFYSVSAVTFATKSARSGSSGPTPLCLLSGGQDLLTKSLSGFVKVFGCRPHDDGATYCGGPAYENLQGRKPRAMRCWRCGAIELWGFERRGLCVEVR